MIAAVEFKWRVTGTGIFGVIIFKLSNWLEPGPIILLKVDENSEVGLYGAVLPLCLAVNLSVKRGG